MVSAAAATVGGAETRRTGRTARASLTGSLPRRWPPRARPQAARAPMVERADDALGQQNRDGDKEAAEEEEPDIRRRAGEPGLGIVHQHGPQDGAVQVTAPADRHPDDDLNRVGRRELARIDDADLRH